MIISFVFLLANIGNKCAIKGSITALLLKDEYILLVVFEDEKFQLLTTDEKNIYE